MLKTSVILENLHDLEEVKTTTKLIREAGFEAVDAALFFPEVVNLARNGGWQEHAREVRKIVEGEGLTIFQCHQPFATSPEQLSEKIEEMKWVIPFAGAIGAQNTVVHPIRPNHVKNAMMNMSFSELHELNVNMFRELLPLAVDAGVKICGENLFAHDGPGAMPCYTSHAEELNDLVDALPQLGMCLDVGHACICEENPAEMVRQLGKNLTVLHLHGNNRIGDLHLTPFETKDMGWDDFCRALKEVNYQGTLNLEVLSFVRNTPRQLRREMYAYLHACAQYFAELVEKAV